MEDAGGGIWLLLAIAMGFIMIPVTWYCMTDGGTYSWSWGNSLSSSTSPKKANLAAAAALTPARAPRELVVDLAYAHHSDDLPAAIEAWREFPHIQVDELMEEMGIAHSAKQPWLGQQIDQPLWLSWKKFLETSYAESREDFILGLESAS